MYENLATKYRPMTLGEVLGQDAVKTTLANAGNGKGNGSGAYLSGEKKDDGSAAPLIIAGALAAAAVVGAAAALRRRAEPTTGPPTAGAPGDGSAATQAEKEAEMQAPLGPDHPEAEGGQLDG